jgi:hypothetical protein
VKLQAYVERRILRHRDNIRKRRSNARGPLGLGLLPGWKKSKLKAPGHDKVDPHEEAEDDPDDAYSDRSCSESSSVTSRPDTRQSHQRQKMRHYGAPTTQIFPGQCPVARTQANDGVDRCRSVSCSLSETASDVDPSDRHQDQSGHTASKHVRPTDGEVEHSYKRRKLSRKVNSPKPCLAVNFKLTEKKQCLETQCPQHRSGCSAPATADSSLRKGPNNGTSHNDLLPMQGCQTSCCTQHNTLREDSEESEDIAVPSPRQSLDSNSYTPRSGRTASPPMIDTCPQQEVTPKGDSRTAEPTYIVHEEQVTKSKNELPASAASLQTLEANSVAEKTAVRDTTPDTAETTSGPTPTTLIQPSTEQLPSAEVVWEIIMILDMKRGMNEEAQSVGVLILEEGVTTTHGLFTAIQEQVGELLDADETIARVEVKGLSESLTKDLVTDFIMTPKASVKDRTWDLLIKGLQDDKTRSCGSRKLKLRATVFVRKAAVRS